MSAKVVWPFALLACAGGCSGGDTITCGEGTVLSAKACVAKSSSAADGPAFGGVVAVAPVSTTSLFATWGEASAPATPAERMRFAVFLGSPGSPIDYAKPVATTEPGASYFYATKLDPAKTYDIAVRAVDESGKSDANLIVKSTTPALDADPPVFGGLATAEPAQGGAVTLKWPPAQDNLTPPEAVVYYVYVAEPAGTFDFALPTLVSKPGATTATVSGLYDPAAVYRFLVRARDAAENLDANVASVTSPAGRDTTSPRFGGCKTAVADSAGSAVVSWEPAVDDTTPPERIEYDIYAAREEGQFDLAAPFSTATGTASKRLLGLTSNTTWHFMCRARDLSGNRDANEVERVAKTRLDDTLPTFDGLTGAEVDGVARAVLLSWAPGADDKSDPSQLVYDVYEAETPGGEDFNKPPRASSAPGATSVLVTDLAPSRTLYWVVRVRDEGGNHDTNVIERDGKIGVSFSREVQPIFTHDCAVTGCHVPGNPPAGLILATGFAYSKLVNVKATEVPTDNLVTPGDPTASYVYKKISLNPPPVGWQMPAPATGSALTSAEKELIRTWILQGAANN